MTAGHSVAIIRLQQLPPDRLTELVAESEASRLRFVRRLVDDWEDGRNRFEGPQEALLAAAIGSRIVGVCGLNADPFTTVPGVGRLRRLYVLSSFRGRGVGGQLVRAVVAAATGVFRELRLRTRDASAARFYEHLGFEACAGVPDCTHLLRLGPADR